MTENTHGSEALGVKPCPFCGSDNVAIRPIRDGKKAVCPTCHAEGPPAYHGPGGWQAAIDAAEDAWNRRYPDPPTTPPPLAGEGGINCHCDQVQGVHHHVSTGIAVPVPNIPDFWAAVDDSDSKMLRVTYAIGTGYGADAARTMVNDHINDRPYSVDGRPLRLVGLYTAPPTLAPEQGNKGALGRQSIECLLRNRLPKYSGSVPTDARNSMRAALEAALASPAVRDEEATEAMYLFVAYGESDFPLAIQTDDPRSAFAEILFGGSKNLHPMHAVELDGMLEAFDDPDGWSHDGRWSCEFEIGGVHAYKLRTHPKVAAAGDETLRKAFEAECDDVDKIIQALGMSVEQARTAGGSLHLPRILERIRSILAAEDGWGAVGPDDDHPIVSQYEDNVLDRLWELGGCSNDDPAYKIAVAFHVPLREATASPPSQAGAREVKS